MKKLAELVYLEAGRQIVIALWYDAHVARFYASAPGRGGCDVSAVVAIEDAISAWRVAGMPAASGHFPTRQNGWEVVPLLEVLAQCRAPQLIDHDHRRIREFGGFLFTPNPGPVWSCEPHCRCSQNYPAPAGVCSQCGSARWDTEWAVSQ